MSFNGVNLTTAQRERALQMLNNKETDNSKNTYSDEELGLFMAYQQESTGALYGDLTDEELVAQLKTQDDDTVTLASAWQNLMGKLGFGAAEEEPLTATQTEIYPAVFSYDPQALTEDQLAALSTAFSALTSGNKTPLNNNDLKTILEGFYYAGSASGSGIDFKQPELLAWKEDDYIALLSLFARDGAKASDVATEFRAWMANSSKQIVSLGSGDSQTVEINGKKYKITSKADGVDKNSLAYSVDENGQVVFYGDDFLIEDASTDGKQADNVKVIGDNNKTVLFGGDNTAFVVGNFNSILGGVGKDTFMVDGDNNYADMWAGDDTLYMAGDSNIAFGFSGSDNFFVKGNKNFIDGEGGNDSIYNLSSSSTVKSTETNLTSAPDFFKTFGENVIDDGGVIVPPGDDDDDDSAPAIIDTKGGSKTWNLPSGKSENFTFKVDGETYSFTIKNNGASQNITYSIDANGQIVVEGDNLVVTPPKAVSAAGANIVGKSNTALADVSGVKFNAIVPVDISTLTDIPLPSEGIDYPVVIGGKVYMLSLINTESSEDGALKEVKVSFADNKITLTADGIAIDEDSSVLPNGVTCKVAATNTTDQEDPEEPDEPIVPGDVHTFELESYSQDLTINGITYKIKKLGASSSSELKYSVDSEGKVTFDCDGVLIDVSASTEDMNVQINGENNIYQGGSAVDTVFVNGNANTINANAGDDVITTLYGEDNSISAGAGNDTLNAGADSTKSIISKDIETVNKASGTVSADPANGVSTLVIGSQVFKVESLDGHNVSSITWEKDPVTGEITFTGANFKITSGDVVIKSNTNKSDISDYYSPYYNFYNVVAEDSHSVSFNLDDDGNPVVKGDKIEVDGAGKFLVSGNNNIIKGSADADNISIQGNYNKVYAGAGNDTINIVPPKADKHGYHEWNSSSGNYVYGEGGDDTLFVGDQLNYVNALFDGGQGSDTIVGKARSYYGKMNVENAVDNLVGSNGSGVTSNTLQFSNGSAFITVNGKSYKISVSNSALSNTSMDVSYTVDSAGNITFTGNNAQYLASATCAKSGTATVTAGNWSGYYMGVPKYTVTINGQTFQLAIAKSLQSGQSLNISWTKDPQTGKFVFMGPDAQYIRLPWSNNNVNYIVQK